MASVKSISVKKYLLMKLRIRESLYLLLLLTCSTRGTWLAECWARRYLRLILIMNLICSSCQGGQATLHLFIFVFEVICSAHWLTKSSPNMVLKSTVSFTLSKSISCQTCLTSIILPYISLLTMLASILCDSSCSSSFSFQESDRISLLLLTILESWVFDHLELTDDWDKILRRLVGKRFGLIALYKMS